MKYKCPCCGYYTFSEPLGDTYDICPVCYWEDDGWQMSHPDGLEQLPEEYKNMEFLYYEAHEVEKERIK